MGEDAESLVERIQSRYLYRLGLIAGAILLIMVVLGANSVFQITEEIGRESERDLQRTSELQGRTVGQWLASAKRQTRLVSRADALEGNRTSAYLRATLRDREAFGDEVVGLHYVDAEGRITASSSADAVGSTAVGADFWGSVGESVTVSSPYSSSLTDARVFALVAPVEGGDGAVVAVVDTSAAADQLLQAPREGRAFVVDRRGRILLSTDQQFVDRQVSNASITSSSVLGVPPGQTRYVGGIEAFGRVQATGVAGLSEGRMTVGVQQPRDVAFRLSETVQLFVVLLLGGMIMSFVLFLTAISRDTITDVRELARKAERVAREGADADISLETDRRDEIGSLYESIDDMQQSLGSEISGLEDLNRLMTDAVRSHSEVLDDCAEGDLSKRMDTDTGVDQLDSLAADFNEAMATIEEGVEEAMRFSRTVATASHQAADAVERSQTTSRQVSETTREIHKGARQQDERLEETVDRMQSFSGSIDEVASFAEDLSSHSTAVADTADRGRDAAREAAEQLEAIERETDAVVEAFARLEEEVETIGEITDSIADLADQTNVLATNANIEASRAGDGENAEGFGVVAQEFKEFAEQAHESAENIERRLEAIQEYTEHTGENVDDARAAIEQGTTTVQEALAAIDDVADAVREIDRAVQEIDDLTAEQSEDARTVLERIEEVADIAEDNADRSEDVAAAAQEQADSIDELGDTVGELYDRAERLHELLDRFEIEAEVERTPTSG